MQILSDRPHISHLLGPDSYKGSAAAFRHPGDGSSIETMGGNAMQAHAERLRDQCLTA